MNIPTKKHKIKQQTGEKLKTILVLHQIKIK